MTEIEKAIKFFQGIEFCDYAHKKGLCTYQETGCSDCAISQGKNALEDALRRIAEDDKAFPCKVGDEVRATVQRPYNGNTATIHGVVSDIQTVVRVSYHGDRHVDFLASDFGKTVFLTRHEAEAALEGTE